MRPALQHARQGRPVELKVREQQELVERLEELERLLESRDGGRRWGLGAASGARGITEEQLEDQTEYLKGATMPDGSRHP